MQEKTYPEERVLPETVLTRLHALDSTKQKTSRSLTYFLSIAYIGILVWAVVSPDSFGYRIAGSYFGLGITVITLFVLVCFLTTLRYANVAASTREDEEELIEYLLQQGYLPRIDEEIERQVSQDKAVESNNT